MPRKRLSISTARWFSSRTTALPTTQDWLKILKKYDKRTGDLMRLPYIQRVSFSNLFTLPTCCTSSSKNPSRCLIAAASPKLHDVNLMEQSLRMFKQSTSARRASTWEAQSLPCVFWRRSGAKALRWVSSRCRRSSWMELTRRGRRFRWWSKKPNRKRKRERERDAFLLHLCFFFTVEANRLFLKKRHYQSMSTHKRKKAKDDLSWTSLKSLAV